MTDLDTLIAKARLLPSSRGVRAFARIRRLILRQLQQDPRNAHLALAMGVCWYLSPEESDERVLEAKLWLERALELDSGLARANLYLGHLYFDQGLYRAALEFLERVPPNRFRREDQAWRDAKRAELVLVSVLYLGLDAQVPSAGAELLKRYRTMRRSDRPVPSELSACLARLPRDNRQLRLSLNPILQAIYRLTDLADYESLSPARHD